MIAISIAITITLAIETVMKITTTTMTTMITIALTKAIVIATMMAILIFFAMNASGKYFSSSKVTPFFKESKYISLDFSSSDIQYYKNLNGSIP